MNCINTFLEFENEKELFDKKIQDLYFWQYIRFTIYFDILKQKEDISDVYANANAKRNLLQIAFLLLKHIPLILRKNTFFNLQKSDLLVLNHSRRIKNGEFYDCMYTDDVLRSIDLSYCVIEDSYDGDHLVPTQTKNLHYTDILFTLRSLKRKFYSVFNIYALNKKEKEYIYYLVKEINNIFDVNISTEYVLSRVQYIVLNYKATYKHYEKIIDTVNPKIIMEVVSYDIENMIFNEIAKKRNIPIIELQHGTMGKYHIAYNFLKKNDSILFPDHVFVFGDFWKETTRLPINDDKISVVGFPYFEKSINKSFEMYDVGDKKNIVFISQLIIGEKLSRFACEVAQKIDHDAYRIIYKLHPSEYSNWKEMYPWLDVDFVEVIDNNEKDIYFFLKSATFQVGCFSTALFEGMGFNLKTVIYKTYGSEYVEDLYENGYAKLVSNSDELIKFLHDDDLSIPYSKERMWKSNALFNLKKRLKEIKVDR